MKPYRASRPHFTAQGFEVRFEIRFEIRLKPKCIYNFLLVDPSQNL
jgi:hypothetical protein